MKLTITREFYDYFGHGTEYTHTTFNSIVEGYKEFKRISSKDFDYGDTFQYTRCSLSYEDYPVTLTPQRPHARSKAAWLGIVEDKKLRALYPLASIDLDNMFNTASPAPVDEFSDIFPAFDEWEEDELLPF